MEQIIVPSGDHDLLTVEPEQLDFQLELGKSPARCTIKLSNGTKMLVAFKVRTNMDPRMYDVRPDSGVVQPSSVSYISISMGYPTDKSNMDSKRSDDAFLIESVLAGPGITAKNAIHLFKRPQCPVKGIEVRVVHTFLPHVGSCSPTVPVQQMRNLTRKIVSQDASHLQSRNRNKRPAASQLAPTQLLLQGISNTNEQGKNGAPDGFRNVVAMRLCQLVYWLFTQMSHMIWGLRVLIAMFIVRIIGKLVDDSVEEWILKIACQCINNLASFLYEKVVNMGLFSSSS